MTVTHSLQRIMILVLLGAALQQRMMILVLLGAALLPRAVAILPDDCPVLGSVYTQYYGKPTDIGLASYVIISY